MFNWLTQKITTTFRRRMPFRCPKECCNFKNSVSLLIFLNLRIISQERGRDFFNYYEKQTKFDRLRFSAFSFLKLSNIRFKNLHTVFEISTVFLNPEYAIQLLTF